MKVVNDDMHASSLDESPVCIFITADLTNKTINIYITVLTPKPKYGRGGGMAGLMYSWPDVYMA